MGGAEIVQLKRGGTGFGAWGYLGDLPSWVALDHALEDPLSDMISFIAHGPNTRLRAKPLDTPAGWRSGLAPVNARDYIQR